MAESRPNRLIHEKSPYLLQHAHNPVDWYPWGDEAFTRALDEQKPILLSVGYSACHWCHVMERESFEDEETATLMNRLYVSVKVDREERPDVDQVYQHTVQMLSGQGGWPLTAFLTPDRKPFFAGTYFPPDERYGRPSFRRVLAALAQAWDQKRDDVEQNVTQLMRGLAQINELAGPGEVSPRVAEEAATALLGRMDPVRGGFRGAPKFPNCTSLAFLLGRSVRGGDAEAREAVFFALRQMAAGGIYDQLGGGFHRYSVDDRWLVPHFEKMLYDNGQLLGLYLDGWRLSGDEAFAEVARETAAYALREMRSPEGGFYAAQDADSEGEEGRFFVWTPAQVAEVAGAEGATALCAALGITEAGNFETSGATVLHRPRSLEEVAAQLGRDLTEVVASFEDGRRALFAAREERVKPTRDDKIITAWNGLMIAALARSPEPEHVQAAADAARFVLRELRPDGELMRSYCDGAVRHRAVLDDYAFLADGLLRLYQATLDPTWLGEALRLADGLVAGFWDPDARAFYLSGANIDLIQRPRSTFDQAIPSGAGVAARVLSRLGALTGHKAYVDIVDALLGNHADSMERNPFGFGTLLDALDGHLRGARELVIVGRRDDPATLALVDVAQSGFDPDLLVCQFDPEAPGPEVDVMGELLEGKRAVEGRPTAYVCQGQTCSAPLTDPKALAEILWR